MIMRNKLDKPGLSRKTRFYGGKQSQNLGFFFFFLAKPGFSIDIPGFSNRCFKNLPFLQKNLVLRRKPWFNRAKPAQNLLLNVHSACSKLGFASVVQFTMTAGKPNAH